MSEKKNKHAFAVLHDDEQSAKIASAFRGDFQIPDCISPWVAVNTVLDTQQKYTIGLDGRLNLSFGEIQAQFPRILLTDQLTNSRAYTVLHDIQDDLSLLGVGRASYLFAGLGTSEKDMLLVKQGRILNRLGFIFGMERIGDFAPLEGVILKNYFCLGT
ncbi:MAG: hypothetical protein KKD18_06285 [Nanoarchaeota archaeon]|nr:hypothetical protein [Nanoarchaeota archaeon]MBU0978001.1 hypothetical protein [Nanoarchaeota archaeon]